MYSPDWLAGRGDTKQEGGLDEHRLLLPEASLGRGPEVSFERWRVRNPERYEFGGETVEELDFN